LVGNTVLNILGVLAGIIIAANLILIALRVRGK
jgi:hypothetical protein